MASPEDIAALLPAPAGLEVNGTNQVFDLAPLALSNQPIDLVGERQGAFTLGIETGFHQSLANYGTGVRLARGKLASDLLDETQMRERIGARNMTFKPGLTAFEWDQLAKVYDREQVFQRIRERGDVTDTGAFFLGNLVGSLVDPVAVGAAVVSAGFGSITKAASAGARLSRLQQFRKAMQHRPALAGGIAGAAGVPFDMALVEEQGQFDYTIEAAALTIGASAGLAKILDVGIQMHRRAREKATNAPLMREDDGVSVEEQEMIAEGQTSEALEDPYDSLVEAHRQVRDSDSATMDQSARPQDDFEPPTEKSSEFIQEQELAGTRQPDTVRGGFDTIQTTPEVRKIVDSDIEVDGVPARFTDPIDRLLFEAGEGNEDALDGLVNILRETHEVGNVTLALKNDLRGLAKEIAERAKFKANQGLTFGDQAVLVLGGTRRITKMLDSRDLPPVQKIKLTPEQRRTVSDIDQSMATLREEIDAASLRVLNSEEFADASAEEIQLILEVRQRMLSTMDKSTNTILDCGGWNG